MPKTQFPALARAVAELTPRQREMRAMIFETSDQPLLQALAKELLNANTVEAAEMAQRGVEAWQDHRAGLAEVEAELPAPGGDEDRLAAQQQADTAFVRLEGVAYIDEQLHRASKAMEKRLPRDGGTGDLPSAS